MKPPNRPHRSLADEAAILSIQARAEEVASRIAFGMVELGRLNALADRMGFELTQAAKEMAQAAKIQTTDLRSKLS